jgi:hypothetical protein
MLSLHSEKAAQQGPRIIWNQLRRLFKPGQAKTTSGVTRRSFMCIAHLEPHK